LTTPRTYLHFNALLVQLHQPQLLIRLYTPPTTLPDYPEPQQTDLIFELIISLTINLTSIFLILSNTGRHFYWSRGPPRCSRTRKTMDTVLSNISMNENRRKSKFIQTHPVRINVHLGSPTQDVANALQQQHTSRSRRQTSLSDVQNILSTEPMISNAIVPSINQIESDWLKGETGRPLRRVRSEMRGENDPCRQ
jgi:hypothetical protein